MAGGYNNNNNNSGGRGGRGRGRGGRGGGRGGRGGRGGILNVCRDFLKGNCTRGDSCHFSHIVSLHAQVQAATQPELIPNKSNNNNNRYNNNKASVSSIAIWEQQPGQLKIFTGSTDGYWRLWNPVANPQSMRPEFEHLMNGKVHTLLVKNNFLVCGFEAPPVSLPTITVGMCHIWNLQAPSQKPLELHAHSVHVPYAHNTGVTAVAMHGHNNDPSTWQMVTGSRDGTMRLWKLENNVFVVVHTLMGHAREVTSILLLPDSNTIWSSGTDQCLRIWDATNGTIKHTIGPSTMGHTHAVTDLVSYDVPNMGTFVISCSLDKTVKVWNASNGECVHSESHEEGIVSMCIVQDVARHNLLLLGLENGSIQCRTLQQHNAIRSFEALFTLSYHQGVGHQGAVKSLTSGPSSTFYSGGHDGKLQVFSLVGDVLAQQ